MKIKQMGRGGETPSQTKRYLPPNQGFALVSTIIALLVLTVIVTVALKTSLLGGKLAYFRKEKVGLNLVAQQALDMIQLRITQRMNPPPTRPNGTSWTIDTYQHQALVGASCDRSPNTKCWCDGTGCYHGYRFQRGLDLAAPPPNVLDEYALDFKYEAAHEIGIFEPCTTANGKCPANAQWRVRLPANQLNPVTAGNVDILNNPNIPDRALSADVEVTAFDDTSGKRAVLRGDLLLVAGMPTTDATFGLYANVISKMSLFSGYIRGAVAQFLDPDHLPKSAAGTPLTLPYFNYGEMGLLHYSCKSYGGYGFGLMAPCSTAMASNERKDYESAQYFTNMQIGGLITNYGLGQITSAHEYVLDPPAQIVGLTIDDQNNLTGDPSKFPRDALTDQDPITTNLLGGVVGRDQYGGIPSTQVDPLATVLNPVSAGNASLSSTGGAGCIYQSTGFGTDSGLPPALPLAPGALNPNHSDFSVVLDPSGACDITVNGTYIIKGDLIIAGDGTRFFRHPTNGTPLDATLIATGNVYILNNINTVIPPPPNGFPNGFRDVAWRASAAGSFDRLGIVAAGHIIIGNLANSNNFAHLLTYANTEIAYFQLDLTGDNQMDLLVPDGVRPSNGPRALGITNYQVRRDSCAAQKAYFGTDLSCDSQAMGLLPQGSTLVDSTHKYKFWFTEPAAGNQVGYGYTRVGGVGNLTADGTVTRAPNAVAPYPSDAVVPPLTTEPSDLFQGGWISTNKFRQFAGALITGGGRDHDSFDPAYINQAHYIAAKLYAGQTITGLASFEDKYTLKLNFLNPDSPIRPQVNTPGVYTSANWSFNLLKDVNEVTGGTPRYPQRCTSSGTNIPYGPVAGTTASSTNPIGIDIFGGVFARYVNITSTNGLCIYSDDRSDNLGHEPINVIPGGAYHEDPNAQ